MYLRIMKSYQLTITGKANVELNHVSAKINGLRECLQGVFGCSNGYASMRNDQGTIHRAAHLTLLVSHICSYTKIPEMTSPTSETQTWISISDRKGVRPAKSHFPLTG